MATDTTSAAVPANGRSPTPPRISVAAAVLPRSRTDRRRPFHRLLDLLAEDLHYWAPTRSNRLRRQQSLAVAARGEAAFFDETRASLAWRIRRFDSGMAWAEDPPSRTRHL